MTQKFFCFVNLQSENFVKKNQNSIKWEFFHLE